jgi:hypothetical protein
VNQLKAFYTPMNLFCKGIPIYVVILQLVSFSQIIPPKCGNKRHEIFNPILEHFLRNIGFMLWINVLKVLSKENDLEMSNIVNILSCPTVFSTKLQSGK